MDTMTFKQEFIRQWERYFPGAELPVVFYYTDEKGHGEAASKPTGHRCIICDLAKVRNGKTVCFELDSIGCGGGQRYLGFTQELRPQFEYFLSCGIPGQLEGERYKKSPELVNELLKHQSTFDAPGRYIVFKRWDLLEERDDPVAAVFFATPDVLSGLFTLANFDIPHPHGVIAPMCAGCASIVYSPYQEGLSQEPRAVLGMFDVSARPCVPSRVLTFAVPWARLVSMVRNMDESFLITGSWEEVRARIDSQK